MTIGIDATNLLQGGGVTHIVELLEHAKPTRHHFTRIVIWGSANTLKKIPERHWLEKKSHPYLNKSLLFRTFWKTFHFRNQLRLSGCDILFVPGGSDATGFQPMVTMCQNLLPFEWQEAKRFGISFITAKLLALRKVQSRTFRKATGLIFLTKYASDVVRKVIAANPITSTTIPHGIGEKFFRTNVVSKKDSSNMPIKLLYVSILDPYKHHLELLKALQMVSRDREVHLTLIGPEGSSSKSVHQLIEEINKQQTVVTYLGAVPYTKLHTHLRESDIGIFASSCENMPIILMEMMAAGLPIACSNKGPMPEVLGDAGVYFNPESPNEISTALQHLIDSPDLRSSLAEKAFEIAKQYSWDKCADETFSFLAKVHDNYLSK